MAERIRRFVNRSPRYVLRPQDRKVMRFGLHGEDSLEAEQTLLVNLSETGVAFLVESRPQFHMHDLIKVEIPVPGGEQIAWWARVVRIEEYDSRGWFSRNDRFDRPMMMIGARFEELPEGHSRALRRGIEKSFLQAVRDQRYRTWMYYRVLFMQNVFKLTAFAILTLLTFALLYYWARPGGNYDEHRGSPWGQRFK